MCLREKKIPEIPLGLTPLVFCPIIHEAKIHDSTNSFFNYTSGRWLYNEHLRLSERQLYFNINELCHVVAKSVGLPHTDIVLVTKLAEGGSYRIFEATFRNGLKAIARLPYPCTVPREYGVASEVATMEFLRMHGIPIPKILDWSSSAFNQLGSEYIIMERVPGRELADTWHTMTFKERMAVVEKIVDIERILFGIRFPTSGSLFFKGSLDPDVKSVDMPDHDSLEDVGKFCIGPSTEYLWWYQKRNELAANRGPWKSSEEVLKAVGEREILWLQRYGEKRYPREPFYRELYHGQKVDPQAQIQHLVDYLKVAPHLVPKVEQLNNYGDDDSENFRRPKLAEDFANMTSSDKEVEMERYRRRQVHYFYLGYTSDLNKAHFHAMGKHNLVLRNQLYGTAGRPWEGDNTSLQVQLIKTVAEWSEIASPEDNCPVRYSPAEVEECLDRDAKQNRVNEQMQQVRDFIGINIDGLVPNEEFESARARAELIKNELAEGADTDEQRSEFDRIWPFQDHEEID
ncbi:serine/threonine protein kinase [Leptodontidium sp. 2 PMI_412]|nr:serine/threonine protein kinase [Leptodontidium sp. 2 PMI_412]